MTPTVMNGGPENELSHVAGAKAFRAVDTHYSATVVYVRGVPEYVGTSASGLARLASGRLDRADWRSFIESASPRTRFFHPPNVSHAKLCGPSRVPKPKRRDGCRD